MQICYVKFSTKNGKKLKWRFYKGVLYKVDILKNVVASLGVAQYGLYKK